MAAIAIVFGLSFRAGDWNLYRLLLTGVVLSAGCTALTTLILTLAPASDVKGMLFWLMGDVSRAEEVLPAWITLIVVMAMSMLFSGSLNVLEPGPDEGKNAGCGRAAIAAWDLFLRFIGDCGGTDAGGRHRFCRSDRSACRPLAGRDDFRWLLPLSVLLGGSFLTLADTLARTLWAPQQLPVGVLTALLGVPMLLILLSRKQ